MDDDDDLVVTPTTRRPHSQAESVDNLETTSTAPDTGTTTQPGTTTTEAPTTATEAPTTAAPTTAAPTTAAPTTAAPTTAARHRSGAAPGGTTAVTAFAPRRQRISLRIALLRCPRRVHPRAARKLGCGMISACNGQLGHATSGGERPRRVAVDSYGPSSGSSPSAVARSLSGHSLAPTGSAPARRRGAVGPRAA